MFDSVIDDKGTISHPNLVGDVASWYLPHVESLMQAVAKANENPDIRNRLDQADTTTPTPTINFKVVALIRDKQDCVNSWDQWLKRKGNNFFMWTDKTTIAKKLFPRLKFNTYYHYCFPKFKYTDAELANITIKQGADQYYDYYNREVHRLKKVYPDLVKIYDTYEILNDKDLQREMLTWLNLVEDPSRGIKFNFDRTSTASHQTNPKRMQQIKQIFERRRRRREALRRIWRMFV